jgi:hypothetical protein
LWRAISAAATNIASTTSCTSADDHRTRERSVTAAGIRVGVVHRAN